MTCVPQLTVGTQITATCLLTSGATNVPTDPPGTVYAFSRSPTGVYTALTTAHPAVGTFTAAFVPNAPGLWVVGFSDVPIPPWPPVGSTFVPESQFIVFPLT